MFFPHALDKEPKKRGGGGTHQQKMSVTTVGDVVNIKKRGWRARGWGGGGGGGLVGWVKEIWHH